MNLQVVKARWPLWGACLLLPLLALGFYLDNKRQQLPVVAPQSYAVESPDVKTPAPDQLPAMHKTAPASNSARQEPDTPEATPPETVVLEPEAARQAVFLKENAVYQKATYMFEAEPVDAEWASGYEQSLRDMFAAHSGLTRVSVNTVSCRSSMCRIEVFTPRDIDADYFTGMFFNAMDNFRDGSLKAEASIARRMEQGITSVYIARKGHTLGFY